MMHLEILFVYYRKNPDFIKEAAAYCYHRDNMWNCFIMCWHICFDLDDSEQTETSTLVITNISIHLACVYTSMAID